MNRGIYRSHLALLLAALLAAAAGPARAGVSEITAWSYYLNPPFVIGDGEGLSFEFIALLNRFAAGRYRFRLALEPRTRINRHLDHGEPGVVLFVNWAWMDDPERNRFLWTPALLSDRNEIVSRAAGKAPLRIDYRGPESLRGLVFGGELGRRYRGLEARFADGSITRHDSRREELNLDMLLRGRIDVTSAAASFLRYKVRAKGIEERVYFSPQPLFSYTRHILVTPELEEVRALLEAFIEALADDPAWAALKQTYQVE